MDLSMLKPIFKLNVFNNTNCVIDPLLSIDTGCILCRSTWLRGQGCVFGRCMGKSCNLVRNLSEPMYKSPRSCFPFTSEKTHRCHNRFYSWLPSFQAMFSRFDTTGSGVMEDGGLVYQYITLWKNGATCRGCPRRWPKFSSFCHAQKVNKIGAFQKLPPILSHHIFSHRPPARRSNFRQVIRRAMRSEQYEPGR